MGCGFDDADTDFVAEEEPPNALGFENNSEPWEMPALSIPPDAMLATGSASLSSQSTRPEKPTSTTCADKGGSNLAIDSKRRRISKKTALQGSDHATSSSSATLPLLPVLGIGEGPDEGEADSMPAEADSSATAPADVVVKESFPMKQLWDSWNRRKQYLWCFEKVRGYWATLPSTKKKYGEATYRGIRSVFGTMSKAEKTQVGSSYCNTCKAPDYVREAVSNAFGSTVSNSKTFGKTLLLTYNGPWGLKDGEATTAGSLLILSLDEVVALLRNDPATQTLCQELKEFSEELKSYLCCSDVSCCVEVCTNTLKEQGKAKCHIHIWVRCCKKIWVKDATKLLFQGQGPNLSGVMGGMVRDTRQSSFQGMLYTSSMKVGSVFSFATREAFTGYLVQPSWLMNMLQAKKISFDTCKEAVLKTCQNVGKYLKDLEVVEEHHRMKEIVEEVARVQRVLALRRRPFMTLPVVVKWQKQYEQDDFRYRFLVLEGPSQHGKTQFVRSLVPEENILEVTCSGGVPVDFRSFRRHKHKLVLFDEIEAQQVLALRKAFQAGASPVQLGQSQTGIYTYTIFLHRVMFVLCSNTWTESLSKLKPGDANWIQSNQIHITIDQHLYL